MTEQSLMITTNKQPCNNQRQNSEVTHQYYLNSSEYELKTKYLGNSEILRLATLPSPNNQYLG